MITLTILALYLIGCVLAYGRLTAGEYEIDENFIEYVPPTRDDWAHKVSLFSWLALFAGTIVYFSWREKYFFKWSYKKLWREYYKHNPKEDEAIL